MDASLDQLENVGDSIGPFVSLTKTVIKTLTLTLKQTRTGDSFGTIVDGIGGAL